MGKKITRIFILSMIIIAVIFDVVVIQTYGKQASISWVIITEAKQKYPLLNDALFFTMGHLFWRMRTPKGESDKY